MTRRLNACNQYTKLQKILLHLMRNFQKSLSLLVLFHCWRNHRFLWRLEAFLELLVHKSKLWFSYSEYGSTSTSRTLRGKSALFNPKHKCPFHFWQHWLSNPVVGPEVLLNFLFQCLASHPHVIYLSFLMMLRYQEKVDANTVTGLKRIIEHDLF